MRVQMGWLGLAGVLAFAPVARASDRLMLNDATEGQLAAIANVDPEEAKAIVAMRAERGRLSSVEELRSLRFDDETLSSLRSATSIELTVPVDATTRTYDTVEAVLAEFASEPSVQQVQGWANDYANTSPDQVRRWLAQSVTFATLPEVTLDYELQNDWDQGFEYQDENGADPVPGVRPIPVAMDADEGQMQQYQVRLRWELDKLVMSSERIRVINEAQDIVKLRDKLLSEVTRLYFERRRLQVERLLSPKIDLMARVKDELRLMELTANLDAMTGGGFSAALARSRSPG